MSVNRGKKSHRHTSESCQQKLATKLFFFLLKSTMSSQVTFKIRYSLSQERSTEGSNDGEGSRGNKVIAQQGEDSAASPAALLRARSRKLSGSQSCPQQRPLTGMILAHAGACLTAARTSAHSLGRRLTCPVLESRARPVISH